MLHCAATLQGSGALCCAVLCTAAVLCALQCHAGAHDVHCSAALHSPAIQHAGLTLSLSSLWMMSRSRIGSTESSTWMTSGSSKAPAGMQGCTAPQCWKSGFRRATNQDYRQCGEGAYKVAVRDRSTFLSAASLGEWDSTFTSCSMQHTQ